MALDRDRGRRRSAASRMLAAGLLTIPALLLLDSPGGSATFHSEVLATSVVLSESGAGPSTLSLSWTQSQDTVFSSYTVQYSNAGSNGPWSVLTTITTKSDTSAYVNNQTANTTSWWRVIDTDGSGTAASNTLQVTQPPVAQLAYGIVSASSVHLRWTNSATYGGLVAFVSYDVVEEVGDNAFSTLATLTSVGTRNFTVTGLSPLTRYSFYVTTTDGCSACSGGSLSSATNSNGVYPTTPAPVIADARASRTSVDVGQTVAFRCAGIDGVPPYVFTWGFGDGISGRGANVSHAYSMNGTMDAICTATDAAGESATGGVVISVYVLPAVSPPSSSPSSPLQGSRFNLTVTAAGGFDSLHYNWTGLPRGCAPSDAPTISCFASTVGTYTVSVTVTDGNQGSVTSVVLELAIRASFAGLPQSEGYALVSGIFGALSLGFVLTVIVAIRDWRRRKGRDSGSGATGNPPAAESPPSGPPTT